LLFKKSSLFSSQQCNHAEPLSSRDAFAQKSATPEGAGKLRHPPIEKNDIAITKQRVEDKKANSYKII
jgi:hypothetical protein